MFTRLREVFADKYSTRTIEVIEAEKNTCFSWEVLASGDNQWIVRQRTGVQWNHFGRDSFDNRSKPMPFSNALRCAQQQLENKEAELKKQGISFKAYPHYVPEKKVSVALAACEV